MVLLINTFIFVLGLIIGSFLNCLIWRLYRGESLGGRSCCPHCRKKIFWYDNIPVLSFIFLKRRCRFCRQAISWQYPAVELMTAILFVLVWRLHEPLLLFGSSGLELSFFLPILRDFFFIAVLMVVFVYDWRWQLVPMTLLWPAIAVMLIFQVLIGWSLWALMVFGIIGAGFFWLQYILTARKGIGEGDIWLGLFLGLSFPSFPFLFLLIMLAYGLGAIVGLSLMALRRKKWRSRIALGPFLAFGACIVLIWGEKIISWYLKIVF